MLSRSTENKSKNKQQNNYPKQKQNEILIEMASWKKLNYRKDSLRIIFPIHKYTELNKIDPVRLRKRDTQSDYWAKRRLFSLINQEVIVPEIDQ